MSEKYGSTAYTYALQEVDGTTREAALLAEVAAWLAREAKDRDEAASRAHDLGSWDEAVRLDHECAELRRVVSALHSGTWRR